MATDNLRKYLDSAIGTVLNVKRTLVPNYLSGNKKVEKIFSKNNVTFLATDKYVELVRKIENKEERIGKISVNFNIDNPEKTSFTIESGLLGKVRKVSTDKEQEFLENLERVCMIVKIEAKPKKAVKK